MKKNQQKIQNWLEKLSKDMEIILSRKENQNVAMVNIRNQDGKQKTPKDVAIEIKRYQIKLIDFIKRTPTKAIISELKLNMSKLCPQCTKIFPYGEPCSTCLMNFIWCEMVSECVN